MAAIADVIPPAERGRYQGLFGGVFGLATVVGPLLGGFIVEHLSWRWIFYINVPLGVLALVVIGLVFKPHVAHVKHKNDYMGAAFLAASLTCIILFTSQGGTLLPWSSPQLWFTLALGFITLGGFIYEERLADEPIMPLELFKERTFVLSGLIGFIVGFSLFGAITFLPLYLQVAKGSTPSQAGLQILPMMAGILSTSIISGRVISKIGKYRWFPIFGTALVACGMFMLSTLQLATPLHTMYLYMLLLGLGLGMVMQVLVLAVQNAVPFKNIGVATSGATLFRSIGGSVGVATFGAIFTNGLHSRLADAMPPGAELPRSMGSTMVQHLPAAVRDTYLNALAGSMHVVFLVAGAVVLLAFALSWLMQDQPLRSK
jgi:EmrB/QacA subfamily drug resistance transporter